MKARDVEMDQATFEAALASTETRPDIEVLFARFKWARDQTSGDPDAAMAAVNEFLPSPISLDQFIDLMARAA